MKDISECIKNDFRFWSRGAAYIERIEPIVIEGLPTCISAFSITCVLSSNSNDTKESIALYCDKTTAFVSEEQYIDSMIDKILELNKQGE